MAKKVLENQKYPQVVSLISVYQLYNSNNIDDFLEFNFQFGNHFFNEYLYLKIMILSRGQRFDLADKILENLKNIDEESALPYLASIQLSIQ